MASSIGAHAQPAPSSAISDIFGPIRRLFGTVLYISIFILVIVGLIVGGIVGWRYFVYQQQTGQLASTVTHAEVGASETLKGPRAVIRSISPDFYAFLFGGQVNPYALDSVVDDSIKKDIGVKIENFEPVTKFFRPNSNIALLGRITAQGLDKPTELEAFCSLEDYNNDELIPAQLTGLTASGNKGIVPKDQKVEFVAQCNFPEGVSVTKPITAKKAKLVLTYEFNTKAYQRVWFLEKGSLLSMQSQGADPFEVYAINDNLLDSDRKIKSVTSPGPINLGLAIDFPQPLTELTEYLLLVQISRSFDIGNLQRLSDLRIFVPAVEELNIDLAGESDLAGNTQCDFEYIGFSDQLPGYKEYRLAQSKLEETNQDCDKKSLRELAISESDCIDYYKEPLYLCNFRATIVPKTLGSDTIRAEAKYAYKVDKQSVVNIKALSSELV